MTDHLEIRESRSGDAAGINGLYTAAFPDEDLLPLVRELLGWGEGVHSLVATRSDRVVGHVGFTLCRIGDGPSDVALLAPLAVDPRFHRQGIGSVLVRAGFERLTSAGIDHVYVLGDPNYYSRFGFKREDRVATPYPLPEEWGDAWQSVDLFDGTASAEGKLTVPSFWQHEALWLS